MHTIQNFFLLDDRRWEAVGQASRLGVTVFADNRGNFREAALGEVISDGELFMIVSLLVAATEPVTVKVSHDYFGNVRPRRGDRGLVVPESYGDGKLNSRVWFPVARETNSSAW